MHLLASADHDARARPRYPPPGSGLAVSTGAGTAVCADAPWVRRALVGSTHACEAADEDICPRSIRAAEPATGWHGRRAAGGALTAHTPAPASRKPDSGIVNGPRRPFPLTTTHERRAVRTPGRAIALTPGWPPPGPVAHGRPARSLVPSLIFRPPGVNGPALEFGALYGTFNPDDILSSIEPYGGWAVGSESEGGALPRAATMTMAIYTAGATVTAR